MIASGEAFHDVASLMLPASLVVCGLLLDRASLAFVTAVTIGAAAAVAWAESRGLPPATPRSFGHDLLDATLILGITSVGVGLMSDQLRRGLARSRRDEAELRRSEERYRGLIELAADAILIGRSDGVVTEVNRRACELTGYDRESLLGLRMERLFSREELARVPLRYESLGSRGAPLVVERELLRRDGSALPVEMSSKRMPDGSYQSIVRDVSDRRRAEQERLALETRLRQAQKMEAIGRLAGGVAHDFNNLLTAITGSLTLAMRDVGEGSRARRWLVEVDAAAWRAAALTRQLLAFSRKQIIAPRVVDLREVVEGLRPMLARLIGEDVALHTTLPPEPCRAVVDQGQVEQVLLNLAANARDAMPFGGALALDVGATVVDETFAHSHPEARTGPHAVISVKDTGHGMTEEVRTRLFEPFFTTKPAGAGTGLGLAMVYGAVQQNRGWIEVDSAPGHGTTFRIFLPLVEGAAAATGAPEVDVSSLRGSETILLVEDEKAVRDVMKEQLESLGYRVVASPDGASAVAAAQAHVGPIDLLVTDLVMPGMNGRELARRLESMRPGLRTLYTSGYGEDVVARHGVLEPGITFVEKPYELPVLARRLRETLDAKPA
jgi:PAS domain S-box-containing protein